MDLLGSLVCVFLEGGKTWKCLNHLHMLKYALMSWSVNLHSFSFHGGFYQQTGSLTMGSRLEPNYACQIFQQYPGTKPDLYKYYINYDIVKAAVCSKNELDDFTTSSTTSIRALSLPGLSVTRDYLFWPLPKKNTSRINNNHPYQGN